jgi:NADH-quinone oxidoreductase subunit L
LIVMAAVAVVLPFAAALAGMLFGNAVSLLLRGKRRGPALIAVLPTAAATALTAVVAIGQWRHPRTLTGTLTLVQTGSLPIGVSLDVDGLSALVAFMVCCVALAVQVYSIAYMRRDRHYSSYAAFVSLFTAAMLLVVLSGDLLVLYAGWEVMGICSYFLIGHYRQDPVASRAATKAFLVTRLGDVGFLFGVFTLGLGAHSFDIRDAHLAPHATVATLLLLCGVVGKSAQFPLHAWLPDAMAGPTPVSALIHAATMVAAGAYVVARLYPVFAAAPVTLTVLGVIAAISMLGAALAAFAQDDIKRMLAYSTISQVAYMAAGLSVGTRDGAVFHLLAHGAFKALLFLGAGGVVAVVGSSLMRDMGGLRLAMPVTFWSMTIGLAAQAGVPPASGFFSKDTILSQAWRATHAGRIPSWTAWLVLVTALVTAAVTAAYATRAWLVTFFGEQRSAFEAREASPLLRWPVAALAVPALVLGFAGLGSAALRPAIGMSVVLLLVVAAGSGAVFWLWNRDPALDPVRVLGRLRPAFLTGFHFGYGPAVRPVLALARLVAGAGEQAVDGAVAGTGRGARRLGGLLRTTENGNIQAYVSGLLAGVVILVLAVVVLS